MKNEINPVAKTSMIIRKPAEDVFDSFVEPEKLNKFWLNKSSGPLSLGKTVTWNFMVEVAVAKVEVVKFELNKLIEIKWDDGSFSEFRFEEIDENKTILEIKSYGFTGTPEEIMAAAIDSTSGFTIVICDLKTFLEEGRSMNICRDKAELITREIQQTN